MIVKPKFRGYICITAHPEGCKQNIIDQIKYVQSKNRISGPKNVLVIGASTGYGLSSRITATFGSGANTIGVIFEKNATDKRTASAGWYNTAAFDELASKAGYYSKTINGDAFSDEIKEKTIDLIKKDLGKIDLVIYSLASPRRTHPKTNENFSSVLKPIGGAYNNKTVDFHNNNVSDVVIEPATEDEIKQTVAVMGGEDWSYWIEALASAQVLSDGAVTVAYSYVGPDITYPIYRNGTIGKAKDDLEQTALTLNQQMKKLNGKALVAVNKALVTQSSSAIPVLPLYISLLFKIMKEKNIHEGCIEQIYRLFNDNLYSDILKLDEKSRIRIDDLEMRDDVQSTVQKLWSEISTDTITGLTDIEGFRTDFFKLFGFGHENIDYDSDVAIDVDIKGLID